MYMECERYGRGAFQVLDLIEEAGYKATQCLLPALLHAPGRLGGEDPSASALHGGAGES